MSKKERILKNCRENGGKNIPPESFVNYIRGKDVTFEELCEAGIDDGIKNEVLSMLEQEDDQLFNQSVQIGNCQAYAEYILNASLGKHKDEAQSKIDEFDDRKWTEIQSTLSANSLNSYLVEFPQGKHAAEAQELLADLPWLETKRKNTIEAYTLYMQNNPGKHVNEAQAAIRSIQDDLAWDNAYSSGHISAYQQYLINYPNGKHAIEAQNRINSGAAGQQFLVALQNDPNAFMVSDIKQRLGNHVISREDLVSVFGEDKVEAIEQFNGVGKLDNENGPDDLQADTTEVYFWGTPGSGKTCALGTIISTVKKKGILSVQPSSGRSYLYQLSNLFVSDRVCKLPGGTPLYNIPEMIIHLRDKKKKEHRLTLVDLAGELFTSVFLQENALQMTTQQQNVVNQAVKYLKDTRNDKIHFFVVEYGAHAGMWNGYTMENYLDTMVQFLKREKIFTKSTVGVYVLVTKCDKIPCAESERPEYAYNYVNEELPSFWNTLKSTCVQSGISEPITLSFSIGDVFAQQLCVYNGNDTEKVIEELLTKTHPISNIFGWLRR